MSDIESFREQHATLLEHVEHLRALAAQLPDQGVEERAAGVERVLGFLRGSLIPHAEAEERVLYPAVAELLGSPEATATMITDHRAVVTRIEELAQTSPDAPDRLQELLYGLYALLVVHFRKEEEDDLPLLEGAAPERVATIFEQMGQHASGHSH
jgi:iron-sulfur cluster repair protein YtfE (RIC family)